MLHNGGNTEGLFHAAFMQSGAPLSTGDITDGQAVYDQLVKGTGCNHARDTLECLREVPIQAFQKAVNATPGYLGFTVCK